MKRIAIIVLTGLMAGVLLFAGCGVPQAELEERDAQIAQLQAENNQLKTEKTQLETEKANLAEEKATLEIQVADLEAQLAKILKLEDPTYAEAVAFIKEDKTNEEVPMDHILATILVAENAAKRGIKGYWVIARLAAGFGYNFIGFNTTDRGWTYFCNSMTCGDQEVKLEVGKKAHQLNPQWGTPGFDDTIVSIHYLPIP